MDVMLHRRCAKFIYVVPEGLRELMSDISREVIRSQPEQMYTFIADYLDAMMITRENARVAARLVDSILRIATMTVGLLEQTGMSRDDADRMAAIIQDAFKRYMAVRPEPVMYESREEEEEEEHEMIISVLQSFGDMCDQETAAAIIIQRAFREFKDRHSREKQLLTGMIDWRVAARSAIYLYRRTGVTIEEANRAATLIKAAYKGYYTRRIMKRLLEEGRQIYEERGGEEMLQLIEEEGEAGSELEQLPAWKQFRDEDKVDYDVMSTTEITKGERGPMDIAESVINTVLKNVVPEPITEAAATVTGPTATTAAIVEPDTPPPSEATEPALESTQNDTTTQGDNIPEITQDYLEEEGEYVKVDVPSTAPEFTEGLPPESVEVPQSVPGEAQQSVPGETQQSVPGEVQQGVPAEAPPVEVAEGEPVVVEGTEDPVTDATLEGVTEPFTDATTEPTTDAETDAA